MEEFTADRCDLVKRGLCMSASGSISGFVLSGLLCLVVHANEVGAAEVVLPFPVESVGVIFVSDPPNRDGHHLTFDLNVHNVRQAQGRVVINDDEFIGLELSEVASKDLSFLGQLPSNSLESLKISGAHLGNEQMRQITDLGTAGRIARVFSGLAARDSA